MNLLIFGPPGSGKGTYATRLAPELGVVKISTGDIFREVAKQNTPIGREVKKIMEEGGLQRDDLTIKLLKEAISKPEAKNGVILDGYPRTIEQAEALKKITKIDAIINLIVPDSVIIERLSGRIQCKYCETIYHKKYLKPKVEGICDKCGGKLFHRKDDEPEVIQERLNVYRKQSQPLIDYYKDKLPFANVSCNRADIPPEIMVNKILEELRKLNLIKS